MTVHYRDAAAAVAAAEYLTRTWSIGYVDYNYQHTEYYYYLKHTYSVSMDQMTRGRRREVQQFQGLYPNLVDVGRRRKIGLKSL